MADEVELIVESVGVRGDGIAHHAGQQIFLPFTAPGDRVRARLGPRRGEGRTGQLAALLETGARAAPVCPHFKNCGGCALQHLSSEAYGTAKEDWLRTALRQHGVAAEKIAPLRRVPSGTRRRAHFALHLQRGKTGTAEIGFHARASHAVVDMLLCAVLHPALLALLPPLRQLAPRLWPRGAEGGAMATLAESGVDLLLDLAAPPPLAALEAMAEFAAAQDLARLAWRVGEEEPSLVAQRRPVRLSFGDVAVDLPEGSFLQASAEAEAALAAAVLESVGPARQVADLFSGLGTFTFPLARTASIHAVESTPAALAALRTAAGRAGLSGRVSTEMRDLEARPLLPEELRRFDAVVFDPPRAGARAQSAMLARSAVPVLVAVSCNPASFARDARTLIDGGYHLATVQPIDAFVWSAQLELVARFEKT